MGTSCWFGSSFFGQAGIWHFPVPPPLAGAPEAVPGGVGTGKHQTPVGGGTQSKAKTARTTEPSVHAHLYYQLGDRIEEEEKRLDKAEEECVCVS